MGGEAIDSTTHDADISNGETKSLFRRLRDFTPMLAFTVLYLSLAAFNFGYDQGNFSGLQAMQSFSERFGAWDPQKKAYYLPSYLQSIMTSTPYLGKLLGSWTCRLITEHIGRRKTMLAIVLLSLIGVSLEISATTAAQFTVGRIFCFYMAGFTVSLVPVYLAECAPPDLRGLIGSQVQFQINFAVMIASFVNLGASNITSSVQWRVTVVIQYLAPVIMLVLWPFLVESPRWLIGRGRHEEAVASLRKLRKKDIPANAIEEEVEFLASLQDNEGNSTWKEIFTGTNRRRTGIACFVMFGQQITGQVFASQYGTIFYQQQKINNPFLMQTISSIVSLCSMFCTSLVLDSLGRRAVLFTGGAGQAVFMFCLGGVGLVNQPSDSVKSLMVVFLILDAVSYNISWAPLSYLTIGEVSNFRARDKTAMLGISVSVITVFVTSFTLPYLLNAGYANLGPKVGFIYGSLALIMVIAAWFIVPELKGRTLDEIDHLFAAKTPTRKFRHALVESTRFEGDHKPELVKDEGGVVQVEDTKVV